ncbi:T-lymphocyte surface antigen Ly-9 isoform X2 [Echeneis naucrates]|uniref:T-lymphocyte surface antigen Ly-9 isoform X2 n=1 Tax=Echeneis naucrates TaxID=173247 RepID=UPI00111336B4|nr:T-lymphocyte surface antigen Ly-9-like isoform X2 [Echeneis naucrates]
MFLLSFFILAGVMAVDSEVTHYQLKNNPLCLHVSKPEKYKRGEWTFAENLVADNDEINPKFTDKVVYNRQNFSLCLKNLTDADTGIYKLALKTVNLTSVSETHRVIVQENVPKPVIKMSVQHSNLSVGTCNITVNCSIQDDWVWSVCVKDSCTTSQKSLSKVNISISTNYRTVFCSGNNYVSTNNVSESIATMCFSKSIAENDKEAENKTSQSPFVVIIVFVVSLCLCAFMAFMAKKISSECNQHQEQASTSQFIRSQPLDSELQPEPRCSTSSSEAEASYENVDTTQTSNVRETLECVPSETVDTVYSILQAQNLMPPPGKGDSSKDAKGHKTTRGVSTSQPVTVDKPEPPAQTESLYSVLQPTKSEVTAPPAGQTGYEQR